jgi:hypothetical protein
MEDSFRRPDEAGMQRKQTRSIQLGYSISLTGLRKSAVKRRSHLLGLVALSGGVAVAGSNHVTISIGRIACGLEWFLK